MSIYIDTLKDLNALQKNGIDSVLTRFNYKSNREPDDLDVLVKAKDFNKVIELLSLQGYKAFSHDKALGSRTSGMQKNLTKDFRIKIDLHKDFTWKSRKYLDMDLIWNNREEINFNSVSCFRPKVNIDIFLIVINLIFEKTYITKEEFDYIKNYLPKIFEDKVLYDQAVKYDWANSLKRFKSWWNKEYRNIGNFPKFLPLGLILGSYFEKFNMVSFAYYIFFRIRYLINNRLPYDTVTAKRG